MAEEIKEKDELDVVFEKEEKKERTPEELAEIEETKKRQEEGKQVDAGPGGLKRVETLEAKIRELEEKLKPTPPVETVNDVDEEEELERINTLFITDPITATKELQSFETKKQQRSQQRYESGYRQQLTVFEKQDGEMYEEIFKEMFDKFNVKHSDNPLTDARINWAEAKASVLARYVEEGKKPTYKGVGDKTPTPPGPSGAPSSGPIEPQKQKQYDPDLAPYIENLRRRGFTEEQIASKIEG